MTRALAACRSLVTLAVALLSASACSESTGAETARVSLARVGSGGSIVGVGDTVLLVATVSQGGRRLSAPVAFRSLTPTTVASVLGGSELLPEASARIVLLAPGAARIEAKVAGHADTLELIAERVVSSFAIDGSNPRDSIVHGRRATITPLSSDGFAIDAASITFYSSNSAVIAVDASGIAAAGDFGEATISVTQGLRTVQGVVRVVPEQLFAGLIVPSLAAGARHACAELFDPAFDPFGSSLGGVFCWGSETSGRGSLGRGGSIGTNVVDSTAQPIATPEQLNRLRVGSEHSCALGLMNGFAYCWGKNTHGELGQGTRSAGTAQGVNRPVAISSTQRFRFVEPRMADGTCALTSTGEAWCWGANDSYQTGRSPRAETDLAIARVPDAPPFASLAGGAVHACGLTSGGVAHCWGASASVGPARHDSAYTPSPVAVTDVPSFVQLALSARESCGLSAQGQAWCWGQTVIAPRRFAPDFAFRKLSARYNDVCGLTTNGAVYCWSVATGPAATAVRMSGMISLIDFAAGDEHMLGVTANRRFVRWSLR